MKISSLFTILALFLSMSFCSCSKQDEGIHIAPPATSGSLLIWTASESRFTVCGPSLVVTLSNGQQSVISNFYNSTPSICSDQLGGYFKLPAGTYTYTVNTVGACTEYNGTVTVIAGTCNLSKIP